MNSNWYSLEGVGQHLLTIEIYPSYTEWLYHGDPVNFHRGIEGLMKEPVVTLLMNELGNNPFDEEDEMFDMLSNLQASIEHERKIEASIGIDIEEETSNM